MTAQDKQLHCHNCQPNSSCDMYVTRHRCSFKVWIILRIDVIEVYFGYFEHFMQAVIPYKKKGSLESNFQQFLMRNLLNINFAYYHTLYACRIESLVESTFANSVHSVQGHRIVCVILSSLVNKELTHCQSVPLHEVETSKVVIHREYYSPGS